MPRICPWAPAPTIRPASVKLAVRNAALSGERPQLGDGALVPLAQARGLALELIRFEVLVGKRGHDIVPLHRLVDSQDDQRLIELGQLLAQAPYRGLHVRTEMKESGGPHTLGHLEHARLLHRYIALGSTRAGRCPA